LKVAEKGCAICQATWGDYWEEVEGQRMFFCCDICAIEFKNMVNEVKKRTGWKTLDEIKMTGNYRGRECTALYRGNKYSFSIRFDSKGGIDALSEHA
jgi:hypothetical protein